MALLSCDESAWSGDGEFTRRLVEILKAHPAIVRLRVEDAPASRSESGFSFISNEVFVGFVEARATNALAPSPIADLALVLEEIPGLGAPDYADEAMLQYFGPNA